MAQWKDQDTHFFQKDQDTHCFQEEGQGHTQTQEFLTAACGIS
jgi:hypothetical protein